jgi:UDP-N-acetylmuramate--alanine ligase
LVRAIRQLGRIEPVFAAELQELPDLLDDLVQKGDVVLCMGAGSIGGLSPQLAERLSVASPKVNA